MDRGGRARDDGVMSQIPGAPQDPSPSQGPPPGGPGGPVPPSAPAHGQPGYGQDAPRYGQPSYGEPGQGAPGYGPPAAGGAPVAEMAPDQQRLWAVLAHLSPLVAALLGAASAGFFYTGWIGPLVIFLVLKDRGIFVRRQAAEALNLQILFTVIYLVGVLLGLVTLTIGFIVVVPVLVILGIVVLVLQIIAAVRANQGVDHRYPINWRLVR